jgi:hypothetical protein
MAESITSKDEGRTGDERSSEDTVPMVEYMLVGRSWWSKPRKGRLVLRILYDSEISAALRYVADADQVRRGAMRVGISPPTRRTFRGLVQFQSPTTSSCAPQA